MDKIFMFDIDGTLTPSRLRMTEKFAKFFDKWSEKNKYYLVTGSDLEKTKEQLPIVYIDRAEAIFTCCGNQMWRDDELIYDNKFELSTKLKNSLEVVLMSSQYPHRYGNHIEDRGSMVNFSIVGRNCTQEQREHFFKWDEEKGERKKISTFLKHKFKDLDAVLGGQISIDIYPKGMDKSQIFDVIKQDRLVEPREYIFIGDRTEKGGNDYPLAKLMEETNNCKYFQTEGPEQTMEILQWLQIDGETK
jgi:phosphomannomutase